MTTRIDTELGTFLVEPLSATQEGRIVDSATNSRGGVKISVWYEEYTKRFVKEFVPADDVKEEIAEDVQQDKYEATDLLNATDEKLKEAVYRVREEYPNLKRVLGESEEE